MCLILLAYRAHPDTSLLLAGNRDEFHARPSAPPGVFNRNPVIHAGRDLEAGGTWMGRNAHGMVAGLTNRRDPEGHVPPDALSRGELVAGLLAHEDPADAADWLAARETARYRPFNVLFGSEAACYFYGSGQAGPPRPLEPGFYALSNSTLDDMSWPKVARCHRFFRRWGHLDGEHLLLGLQAFLCDPTPPDREQPADREEEVHGALGAVFIPRQDFSALDGGAGGYGTVSASIITQGGALGPRYYYAEAAEMQAAQGGWAAGIAGNGEGLLPDSHRGSPFRLLEFPE